MIWELRCGTTGRRFLVTPATGNLLPDDDVEEDRFFPDPDEFLTGWIHADCTAAVIMNTRLALFAAPAPFVFAWGSVGSLVPRPDLELPETHQMKSYADADDGNGYLSPEELAEALRAAEEICPPAEGKDDA